MKKMTMQEFANTFDSYVCKDSNGQVYCTDMEPEFKVNYWLPKYESKGGMINFLLSDSENHDWTALVRPNFKGE